MALSYEDFVKEFMDILKQDMATEKVELERREAYKVNIKLDSISVKFPNSNAAPIIYLQDKYEQHELGVSIAELAYATASLLSSPETKSLSIPELTWENLKKSLYPAVISIVENGELLKNCVFERLEDLAVVVRCKVGDTGSFLVQNSLCETLMKTPEEIMEVAFANLGKQDFICQSISDVIRSFMTEEVSEEYLDELLPPQEDESMMWVLTNREKYDGAVAIASPKALQEAREKIGEDFYVLPSSRHEIILVPWHYVNDVNDLKHMVSDVNSSTVSRIDKLSDSVYFYDGKRLSIVSALNKTEGKSDVLTQAMDKAHSLCH